MNEQLKAFVIMPFDEEFNSIYEDLIRSPIAEAGYEVTRADSLLDQQNILQAIVSGITTADLLIADLTTNNANVFYELGLAHGLRIPTVLIAQSITDVPFDLRSYKIHIYDTHFNKIGKLRDFLKKVAEQHSRKEIAFGNPIIDFHEPNPVGDASPSTSLSESPNESIIQTEKELWDLVVDGEGASNDLTTILAKLLKDNHVVTERIAKHTSSVQMLSNDPTAGSARKFYRVFLLAASDINTFAGKVEKLLPQLEDAIDRLSQSYSGFIQMVDLDADEALESLLRLQSQIEVLLQNTKESKVGVNSFREASVGLAERKISNELSRASRRQAEALNGVISNVEKLEAFCVRALTMINQRLNATAQVTPRSVQN